MTVASRAFRLKLGQTYYSKWLLQHVAQRFDHLVGRAKVPSRWCFAANDL